MDRRFCFISVSSPDVRALGLVVEIGWAYWRQEACRRQPDRFSAAARQAQIAGTFTSAAGIQTQATVANCPTNPTAPSTNNLMTGCLYAQANGFTNSGSHLVMYTAGTSGSPVAGSSPNYWVRFTIKRTQPQPVLRGSGLSVCHGECEGYFGRIPGRAGGLRLRAGSGPAQHDFAGRQHHGERRMRRV